MVASPGARDPCRAWAPAGLASGVLTSCAFLSPLPHSRCHLYCGIQSHRRAAGHGRQGRPGRHLPAGARGASGSGAGAFIPQGARGIPAGRSLRRKLPACAQDPGLGGQSVLGGARRVRGGGPLGPLGRCWLLACCVWTPEKQSGQSEPAAAPGWASRAPAVCLGKLAPSRPQLGSGAALGLGRGVLLSPGTVVSSRTWVRERQPGTTHPRVPFLNLMIKKPPFVEHLLCADTLLHSLSTSEGGDRHPVLQRRTLGEAIQLMSKDRGSKVSLRVVCLPAPGLREGPPGIGRLLGLCADGGGGGEGRGGGRGRSQERRRGIFLLRSSLRASSPELRVPEA